MAVNLDWDHPDYYRDEAALEGVFRALFERTRTAVVIPAGNERLERLTAGLKVPVLRVGLEGITGLDPSPATRRPRSWNWAAVSPPGR